MTEEEAKTKWCPFARFVIDATTAFPMGNRFDGAASGESKVGQEAAAQCLCIASACMAWRAVDPNRPDLRRLELEARIHRPEAVYMVQRAMMEADRYPPVSKGYCGLAGSPQ